MLNLAEHEIYPVESAELSMKKVLESQRQLSSLNFTEDEKSHMLIS